MHAIFSNGSFVNVIHGDLYVSIYPYTDIISMNFTRDVHARGHCVTGSTEERVYLLGRDITRSTCTRRTQRKNEKINERNGRKLIVTVALLSKRSFSSRIVVNISHFFLSFFPFFSYYTQRDISYAWEDIYLALDSR